MLPRVIALVSLVGKPSVEDPIPLPSGTSGVTEDPRGPSRTPKTVGFPGDLQGSSVTLGDLQGSCEFSGTPVPSDWFRHELAQPDGASLEGNRYGDFDFAMEKS